MTCTVHLLTLRLLLFVCIHGLLTACATRQGTVLDGDYTSPNRMFSVRVPKPGGAAGIFRLPYTITPLDTKGDNQYDKVMFHVGDFGIYLVASVRRMPANAVSLMNEEDHRTVLRNLSQASLMGWRSDLSKLPEIIQESFLESQYGEAILRVYRAKKGSFLVEAQERRPTADDVFDTNIASIVARQGPVVVYVLAQNDIRSMPAAPWFAGMSVTYMAEEFFRDIKVLPTR